MPQLFEKTTVEDLDYTVDWKDASNPHLQTTETIATSTWTVDTGLTTHDASNTTTTATIWLSGGTVGVEYKAKNKIVTSANRTIERAISLRIVPYR